MDGCDVNCVAVLLSTIIVCSDAFVNVQKLKELKKLYGEIEIDEALFGGHRKGKRGWGLHHGNRVVKRGIKVSR